MYEDFETMQMRAWPAMEEEWLGSWRLRFSRGFSNRSNSVTPLGGTKTEADLDRIRAVEDRYRSQGLKPCFKLRDDAECLTLDSILGDRGYTLTHPTLVKTVKLSESLAALAAPPCAEIALRPASSLADGFSEAWVATYSALNQRSSDAADYWRTLEAVSVKARTITVEIAGMAAGTGSAIYDISAYPERSGVWVGFYDLAVAPSWRGKGIGRIVLRGLVADALESGCERGYLAVMEGNVPALALYAKAGFCDLYRYWYRKAAS